MKKFALILAMSSVVALTACSKDVNEVKSGTTVDAQAQKHTLVSNNAEAIQKDMQKLETLAAEQEARAGDLTQRLESAVQSQNEEELRKLFPEFKAHILDNLAEMKKLKLDSTEVVQLREKLDAIHKISLSLQARLVGENPDPTEMQELQKKGAALQQEIMAISQKIDQITAASSIAAAPANADQAEQPLALSEIEDAAPEVAE